MKLMKATEVKALPLFHTQRRNYVGHIEFMEPVKDPCG